MYEMRWWGKPVEGEVHVKVPIHVCGVLVYLIWKGVGNQAENSPCSSSKRLVMGRKPQGALETRYSRLKTDDNAGFNLKIACAVDWLIMETRTQPYLLIFTLNQNTVYIAFPGVTVQCLHCFSPLCWIYSQDDGLMLCSTIYRISEDLTSKPKYLVVTRALLHIVPVPCSIEKD